MNDGPKSHAANRIVSLGEFEANKRQYRNSVDELYEAVSFCYDMRSASYELGASEKRYYYEWNPLEEYSDGLLVEGKNPLFDYYCKWYEGKEFDGSEASRAARNALFEKARNNIQITQEIAAILQHILNTQPSKYESHSQKRLRGIIEDFKRENADDEVFTPEGEEKIEVTMYELSEFMDYYQATVLSTQPSWYRNANSNETAIDKEAYEQIAVARESFIAILPQLQERGFIDASQLARAIDICTNIDIYVTDPLSEVFSKRIDTEEQGIGYFMPNDRTIFINSDLIRESTRKKSWGEIPEVQQDNYNRAVIKTVYHELVHAISENWYSSRVTHAPIFDLIDFDYEDGDDEAFKTQQETTYVAHSIFPRFLFEALTETLADSLFADTFGSKKGDYFAYPIERDIVASLFEKVDWEAAGIDMEAAKHLLIKAFFDSASQADTVKRPVASYIEFFGALHTAASPGILHRMGILDAVYGSYFLRGIVESDQFNASDDLAIVDRPNARMRAAIKYYAAMNLPDDDATSFLKERRFRYEKSKLARSAQAAYRTFMQANRHAMATNYGLNIDEYVPLTPEERLMQAIFGEKKRERPKLESATRAMQAAVLKFSNLEYDE